jgi:hypothetical protein
MESALIRPSLVSLLLMSLAFVSPAAAKQKTHSWINGMCEITIRYDDAKVKQKPLLDTVYLLTGAYDRLYVGSGLVSTPDDIAKLDRDELKRQCSERMDKLTSLELLAIPSLKGKLEPLRAELLKTQKSLCDYEDIHLRGYSDASALREYKNAPQCNSFIDALEDDSKLEPTWRDFVKTLCANNASVEDCSQRELKKASLPDAAAHMRITLLAFGWHNCVNPTVWGDNEALRSQLEAASSKLETHFKAKVACEEP